MTNFPETLKSMKYISQKKETYLDIKEKKSKGKSNT